MGLRGVLGLLSGVMALCALLTLWIPETRKLSLDEIEQDAVYAKKSERTAISTASTVTISPAIQSLDGKA